MHYDLHMLVHLTLCFAFTFILFYWPRKFNLQFWPTTLPMSWQASRREAVVTGVMLLQFDERYQALTLCNSTYC